MQSGLDRREFAFLVLAALFISALVVCNLIANKFLTVSLGLKVFTLSAGALPYPITFLVTDLLSEIYGRRRANQVVLAGFLSSLFVLGVLFLGSLFPAIDGSPVSDEVYNAAFQNTWRVIGASMTAYLVAQVIDIRIYHFWRDLTGGRHLWLRNNASTVFSQLVDSALVVIVLFYGQQSTDWMIGTILDLWLFKALCALVDTPLLYAAVGWFRRYVPVTAAGAASG